MGCFHKCALWIMWPWNDLWPLPLGSTSTQKWARCQESPKGYLYQIWTFLVKSEMKYKSMTRAPGGWPLTWASQSMHLMQFPPWICTRRLNFATLFSLGALRLGPPGSTWPIWTTSGSSSLGINPTKFDGNLHTVPGDNVLFLPWAPYPNFDHLWGAPRGPS